jgi:hypothetical protein
MFESLVPYIKESLTKHHELYTGKCKAEYWEENLAYALRQAGYGSNWKPDCNHKSGADQTTDCGIRISNKSGSIVRDVVGISGSRLTGHGTLQEKLEFLSVPKEDYILSLATEKGNWGKGKKIYYFIVIDPKKLNYHEHEWFETIGQKGSLKDKPNGWKMISENYIATITKKMSDQLWTGVKLDACEEIHDIVIG